MGYDTLLLTGGGTFDLSTLAQFTNFEEVDVTGTANLTLRNGVDLTVNTLASGETVHLASGTVTVNSNGNDTYYLSTGNAIPRSRGAKIGANHRRAQRIRPQ
jgi:hypothetical protein